MEEKIQKEVGDDIKLIDIGEYSARNTLAYLKEHSLENDVNHEGKIELHSSDDFESFKENAIKMGLEI